MGQEREIRVIPAAKRDPRVTKVGIYARVSTARAEQLRSLAAQVSTLTRHVYKRYDWILKDTYIDVGSAKTGSSRREFTRMIEECKAGELDYILIKSPSRLGRDSVEVIDAVREILDSGAKLYFEENDLHIDSTNDELPLVIATAVNQAENEQRSENIKLGLKHRAESGKSGLYNRACYGYSKNAEGELIRDEDQAAVVSRIYESYLDGKSFSAIIEELAADNSPSPRGSERWSKKAVETVLRNTKYTGHVEILKTDPARTSYCMWDAHEPIVSVDDFVEVQRQLAKRTKRQRKQESSSSIFVKQMILRGRATAKGRTKAEEK